MIRKSTWLLLILLGLLIGFSFFWKDFKTKQAAQATPTHGPTKLFATEEGSPNDIKIQSSLGIIMQVARDETGKWVLKAPDEVAANQASAEAAASQITALQVLGSVQLGPEIVGLDKPSSTITVTFGKDKVHTLQVGSVTPIQDGYYVQLDKGKIQVVDKAGLDAILELQTDPPYLATPTLLPSPTPSPEQSSPTLEATLSASPQDSTPTSTP